MLLNGLALTQGILLIAVGIANVAKTISLYISLHMSQFSLHHTGTS